MLFSISSKSLICGEIFSSSFIYIFPSVWIKTKSCSFFPSFKRGTHKETAPPPDMMMAARDMMPLESLTPVATVTTAETIIIIISKVAAQFLTQYEMLRARLAHYETNTFGRFPAGFSELLGYSDVSTSLLQFSTCRKLVHLRMFKNGRVDLKFKTAALAKEFAETYLDSLC